jgi:hypothetical protein
LSQIFSIKCIAVPKKFKKKFKKKYLFKLYQIPALRRNNIFLKAFSLHISEFKNRSLEDRLTSMFFTVICGYKDSFLYKKKLYIYKWVLKNKVTSGKI